MTRPLDPSDPLTVLRAEVTPVAPDPAFAAQLWARLADALSGSADTTVTAEPAPPGAPATSTAARFTPYLAVADARWALQWYAEALGATVVGEPIVMPDARIGHAELTIAGARLFLSDEHPAIGVTAPVPGAGAAVTLHLELDVAQDVDRLVDSARRHGATVEREPVDSPYGRQAVIRDPAGHRWMFLAMPAAATPTPTGTAGTAVPGSPAADDEPIRQGDVVHASVWTPDPERARAFYTAVLGWRVEAVDPQRWQVVGQSMSLSLAATSGPPTLFCSYVVDDLDTAIAEVRAAGGSAEPPKDFPWGRSAMGTDPSGRRFGLWQRRAEEVRPPVNGARAGDVAYLTMSVPGPSSTAREFYGAVLGWEFRQGRIDDGWEVVDAVPMTGMAGGRSDGVIAPMWLVDDIEAAVRRVRDAGGTASDPEQQPYGISAECTDDQGTPFYLGQL